MIRINLLSAKKKKKINKIVYELFILFSVLVFLGFSIYIVNSSLDNQVTIIKNEITKLNTEYKRLQKIKAEVDGFKKKKDDLQRKIDIVKRLKGSQKDYYKIFVNIEYALPEDVWVSNFNLNGNNLNLQVSALRSSSVNQFILNLYETKVFNNIDLKVVKRLSVENIDINDFNISANINLGG